MRRWIQALGIAAILALLMLLPFTPEPPGRPPQPIDPPIPAPITNKTTNPWVHGFCAGTAITILLSLLLYTANHLSHATDVQNSAGDYGPRRTT